MTATLKMNNPCSKLGLKRRPTYDEIKGRTGAQRLFSTSRPGFRMPLPSRLLSLEPQETSHKEEKLTALYFTAHASNTAVIPLTKAHREFEDIELKESQIIYPKGS